MKGQPQQKGFSLVEVLCAILILGVGMVGLTHGLTTALSSSKESELQTAAALLAAGRIETLRAEGYLIEGLAQGQDEEGATLYRWRQSISKADLDGLYQVKVIVESATSGHSIYELETLLFDPPIDSATPSARGGRAAERRGERRRR